jgi:hypothetical protein
MIIIKTKVLLPQPILAILFRPFWFYCSHISKSVTRTSMWIILKWSSESNAVPWLVHNYHWVDTSVDGQLLPKSIISPVVSVSWSNKGHSRNSSCALKHWYLLFFYGKWKRFYWNIMCIFLPWNMLQMPKHWLLGWW